MLPGLIQPQRLFDRFYVCETYLVYEYIHFVYNKTEWETDFNQKLILNTSLFIHKW